ncbi:MAG: hypothetical protein J6T35_06385 [Bacteroidales bacterium]|nr:hypothetical protein [Bacteroidales bacterium]
MNRNVSFLFFVLLLVQVLIGHLFQTGPWCVLTLLPAMILCLPTHWSTLRLMGVAFLSGLAVDFLVDGILGLNAFSLVPVALVRRFLLVRFFSEELVSRGEVISWRKGGLLRILGCTLLCTALFLVLYVAVDAAGERAFLPCLFTFGCSLVADLLLSVLVLLAFLEK